ncbi:site-specific recombinase phage integrase family [Clostridium sp. CAG:448]|nr:site-specific recombinase phage integrase family [Clostridium sp. CAG:448]
MAYEVDLCEFPPIVQEFAAYKSAIQGCSEKTVGEYLLDLRTFFRFLLARDRGISPESDEFLQIDITGIDLSYLSGIKQTDIYEFLLYSGSVRKNLWCAKARKLSSIKVFYKYLVNKRNLLEENPAINIETPKRQKTLPKFLSLEECRILLDTVKNDAASDTRLRDYCIITLFLNCGMRVSELVGISLPDIDRELRSLRVVGKGSKERIVYLNDACRAALADYLQEVRLAGGMADLPDKALFLSNRDKRISVKTVQYMVYKYLDLAGLGAKHYSVHKLRHTAATLMYQSGEVDIRVLKDILGHEQLNTTQIYTHVSDKNMQNAMNANPLSSLTIDTPAKKEDGEN